jgi:hypothetical protein
MSSNNETIYQLKREAKRRKKDKIYKVDYKTFAKEQVMITPKDITKGMIKFEFNEAQSGIHDQIEEQLRTTGKVRALILKARQQGISTYCTGRVFWRTKYSPLSRSVVMAHDAATSDALFNMSKDVIENMGKLFKPEVGKSNAKEIILINKRRDSAGKLVIGPDGKVKVDKSQYRLYTAGSPEAGRGTTPTIAHLSEVAFWQYDDRILAGLFQGIPSADGTEVILESTANGASGEFYRLWKGAERGENEYIPIFIPWFITGEYRRLTPDGFMLGEEEQKIADLHSLDNEQMYWRRLKIGESGAIKFQQEYPSTAEEAFVSSGANVFNMEILTKMVEKPPLKRMRLDYESGFFEPSPEGDLKIWRYPTHEQSFLIAADIALGVGLDYSFAVVMNSDREIVATYRNNRIDPTLYGDLLFYLGRYYNNALMCPESNSIGIATVARLQQMNYVNLYHQTKAMDLSGEDGLRPGFRTTSATKPAIIGYLKNAIENGDFGCPDKIIIQELKEYIQTGSGKTEAMTGCTDDSVMATAIALEVHRTHGDRLVNTRIGFKNRFLPPDNTKWL